MFKNFVLEYFFLQESARGEEENAHSPESNLRSLVIAKATKHAELNNRKLAIPYPAYGLWR